MKLTSNLSFRPGLFLTIPAIDLLGSLLLFFLLGSSLLIQSGVRLELPSSSFALRGMADARVLVVSGGAESRLLLDNEEVALDEIDGLLARLAREERTEFGRIASLLIKADQSASHGLVLRLSDLALGHGFRVALATVPTEEQ